MAQVLAEAVVMGVAGAAAGVGLGFGFAGAGIAGAVAPDPGGLTPRRPV